MTCFHITYFLLFTASWAIRAIPCPVTDADRIGPPGVGGAEKHGARGSEMPWPTGALIWCQDVPSAKLPAGRKSASCDASIGGFSGMFILMSHCGACFSWQARFWNNQGKNNSTFQTEVTTQTGDGSTIEQFWKEAASEMCSSSA